MRKGTGNTGESSRLVDVSSSADQRAFDALPKEIRQAIANAPYEYSVEMIYKAYWEARAYNYGFFSDSDFRRDMEYNFRQDVIQMSMTGTERNGNYKFTPTVHEKSKRQRDRIHRVRGYRASRSGLLSTRTT